jgi:O-antigen/teichoic acid export membrane protein
LWRNNLAFSIASISALIRQDLDVIILQTLGRDFSAGILSSAKKMILPVDTLSMPVLAVLGSSLTSDLHRKKKNTLQIRDLLFFSLGIYFLVGLISLFAEPIIDLTLGASFGDSAMVLRILCIWYGFLHLSSVFATIITALREERWSTFSDVGSTLLLVGLTILNFSELDHITFAIFLSIASGFRLVANLISLIFIQKSKLW